MKNKLESKINGLDKKVSLLQQEVKTGFIHIERSMDDMSKINKLIVQEVGGIKEIMGEYKVMIRYNDEHVKDNKKRIKDLEKQMLNIMVKVAGIASSVSIVFLAISKLLKI